MLCRTCVSMPGMWSGGGDEERGEPDTDEESEVPCCTCHCSLPLPSLLLPSLPLPSQWLETLLGKPSEALSSLLSPLLSLGARAGECRRCAGSLWPVGSGERVAPAARTAARTPPGATYVPVPSGIGCRPVAPRFSSSATKGRPRSGGLAGLRGRC